MNERTVTLLRRAIAASGLSARRYATTVLLRDERTVRRWLAGDSPIPQPVVTWLSSAKNRHPKKPGPETVTAPSPPEAP